MPTTVPLDVYRGDDHTFTLVVDGNLTAATLTAEIRALSGGPVLATLDATAAAANTVNVALSAAQSRLLPAGRLKWDLQAVEGGLRRTVLAGPVIVTADVTDSDDPVVNP